MQSQKAAQISGRAAPHRLLSDRMVATSCYRHDVDRFLASTDFGTMLMPVRLSTSWVFVLQPVVHCQCI